MSFLFKAAFWLGLVFLLLPDNTPHPASGPAGAPAPQLSAQGVASAVIEGASSFCRSHQDTCARGAAAFGDAAQRELVRGLAGSPARDTLTPADLAVPFGGIAAPVGQAPTRAPLPPRRPA